MPLCTAAHPLYSGIANIFGASVSEAIMRPNPRLQQDAATGAVLPSELERLAHAEREAAARADYCPGPPGAATWPQRLA